MIAAKRTSNGLISPSAERGTRAFWAVVLTPAP